MFRNVEQDSSQKYYVPTIVCYLNNGSLLKTKPVLGSSADLVKMQMNLS